MIPHTLVLEPGLVIHGIYNGREAWDAGDRSPFHGWNKRAEGSPSSA